MRATVVGCVALAALGIGGFLGAFAIASSSGSPSLPAEPDGTLAHSMAQVVGELRVVEARLASLEQRPVTVERGKVAPPTAEATEPAVETKTAAAKSAAPPAAQAVTDELTRRFDQLLRSGMSADEVAKVFDEVKEQGTADAAVAALQSLIDRSPTDPRAHYLLAKACYARLMLESTPAGFEKWGDQVVKEWTRALELDPKYWEPRYERAEYLTYYPESEGKTPECIRELELLVDQQGRSTSNPRYARTYAHLGRMYLRAGLKDKALETWRQGANLFPGDDELKRQLEVMQGQ